MGNHKNFNGDTSQGSCLRFFIINDTLEVLKNICPIKAASNPYVILSCAHTAFVIQYYKISRRLYVALN